MKKSCSKCGRIHDLNYVCQKGLKKDNSKYHYGEAKLRNTYQWHTKSEQIRANSHYLCSVCLENKIYKYDNLEVHHIVKLKEDKSKLLDNYNLICLCKECHTLADAGMIDKDYLLELARRREDNTK